MHKIHAAVISGLVEQQSVDHSVGSQVAFYSVDSVGCTVRGTVVEPNRQHLADAATFVMVAAVERFTAMKFTEEKSSPADAVAVIAEAGVRPAVQVAPVLPTWPVQLSPVALAASLAKTHASNGFAVKNRTSSVTKKTPQRA
jgi:hypothetical protein